MASLLLGYTIFSQIFFIRYLFDRIQNYCLELLEQIYLICPGRKMLKTQKILLEIFMQHALNKTIKEM